MSVIKTENLTKYYGSTKGIENLSLTVEEGEFFGFIGPNGAGKSTTIRTLLGLISPTKGTAHIFGKDITLHKNEILSNIGYLPSETIFYSGMRVKDVLNFAAQIRKADCKDEALKLCQRLELDINKKVDELSLGNRKKVGIVAALQHRPALYILDEPTSGLDPIMQHEIYSVLKERVNDGATVFLSSHILSEVGKYCKTAAVIRDGSLVFCDKVDNLSHTGVKRITLKGVKDFKAMDNIRDLKVEGETVNFLYSGNKENLLKDLSSLSFEDFNVTDPDLDEVFMHFYKKEEEE